MIVSILRIPSVDLITAMKDDLETKEVEGEDEAATADAVLRASMNFTIQGRPHHHAADHDYGSLS